MTQPPSMPLQGPAWDLSDIYSGPECAEVGADLLSLESLCEDIEQRNHGLLGDDAVATAQQLNGLCIQASTLLRNLSVYASCLLSVNSRDEAAQALQGSLKRHGKRLAVLSEPLTQFTINADERTLQDYLVDPDAAAGEFLVRHARERRPELLSLSEETLTSTLAQNGILAWGALYTQLSGTLSCAVQRGDSVEQMGLAQAAGLLGSTDIELRECAWRGINEAWRLHEETCAASLNAIAGWRLDMVERRSARRAGHFLDAPTHASRIERQTLDSLLGAAEQVRPLARRAAKLLARAYGRERLGPWDVRAPAPTLAAAPAGAVIDFDAALALIATAYASIDPSMGSFVKMMGERRWIEGSLGPNKRPGAYCTTFPRSRTPRVYMSYTGSFSDVMTLAHELGHAYHAWTMRDLPLSQTDYGMSLAETASIFAETLVTDSLLEQAAGPAQRLEIGWEVLSSLVSFVLNIPTRFDFEQRFYERRAERPLRPAEISALMSESWAHWYGDSIAEPDPLFWASKLHFHIAGLSFYNFPYLFGYAFSLGVYAQRSRHGADFIDRFNALLRDTGRMRAEDIASTHLGVDLRSPRFWVDTLNSLAPRVDEFEATLDELAQGTGTMSTDCASLSNTIRA
ncbi:MAG: M3 family oligoendopeptidase [Gammaproteobacteria bacterium]|nr:M3 family oligoendopeptidase [Gammaproteobacteria bacterium]